MSAFVMIADTYHNLRQGLRLAALRRPTAAGLRERPGQLVWLFLIVIATFAISDWWLAGDGAHFIAYQINVVGAAAFLLVMLLALMVATAGGQGRPMALFLAVLAAAPAFVLALGLLANLRADGLSGWVGTVIWLWGLMILAGCMRYAFAPHVVGPFFGLVVGAFFLGLMPKFIYEYPTLWYVPEPSPEIEETLDVERLYYAQAQTLRAHVADLAPERPGVADLYLLAVASDASQTVFADEVEYVRDLFAERFDTAGRALLLVNSEDYAEHYPLANGHNLAAALGMIGDKMNRDEDYLFLYLTAHGSKEHELSASFWPFRFNNIPAANLRDMLEDAGIARRIVVISACYSGGFVEELADDQSLVITAAAADRASFGCSNDRDLTYFAEAYFKDSLATGRSFVDAFEPARVLLREREEAAGYEFSDPQMHVGAAIGPELERLAEALARRRDLDAR